ncbi:hypothetical protein [Pseudoalteromonas luteoviolacea]|uniref:hypothetical protein n=1 Tax=Pseudoalteromonas luteoviolacea TaxID=43657 RepID=UPI001147991A|nr:hypothetical protein [Pseudoalteromonas luteoviolacea]
MHKPVFNGLLEWLPAEARYKYVNFILEGDKFQHLKVVTLERLLVKKYGVDVQVLIALCDRTSNTLGEPLPQLAVRVIYQNYHDHLDDLLDFYKSDKLSDQAIKSQIKRIEKHCLVTPCKSI